MHQTPHCEPNSAVTPTSVHSTCLEAAALALMASRRAAASLALELDSSISMARSVSACMKEFCLRSRRHLCVYSYKSAIVIYMAHVDS